MRQSLYSLMKAGKKKKKKKKPCPTIQFLQIHK